MSWLSDEAVAAFGRLKDAIEHPSLIDAISEVKTVSAAIAEYEPLIALVVGLVPAAQPVVDTVNAVIGQADAVANVATEGLSAVSAAPSA